jgi:dTDP-4-dehydrorhamnose reductase
MTCDMGARILLTGANGQLGETLLRVESNLNLIPVTRVEFDLTDHAGMERALDRLRPDVIINAAAYTAVDAAESDAPKAFAVNAEAPAFLARWVAQNTGSHLIHISTDFVFGGEKNQPYLPDDPTHPLGIYGLSKLAGEQAITAVAPHSTIIRTSWLYSPYGHNFMKTMLRLLREREQLNVVDDQIGTPCSTASLSQCVLAAAVGRPAGIFHWSDAGVASWYDFAVAIQEEALRAGLLDNEIPVLPIPSSGYPTPARRPAYSVLDKRSTMDAMGCRPVHWRAALRDVLRQVCSLRGAGV